MTCATLSRSSTTIQEEEEEEALPVVSLGDASIASPFTSRFNTVTPCLDLVMQGRSTLVTYLQMFKILGINCLSSAYSMSVMHLEGVKMGDTQATVSGVIIAFLFMFLSASSPCETLASRRPHSKVFSRYFMVSLVGQAAAQLTFLVLCYRQAVALTPPDEALEDLGLISSANATEPLLAAANGTVGNGTAADDAAAAMADPAAAAADEYEKTIVNTTVFLVGFICQLSTFATNYAGRPFNAPLRSNKGLFYGLLLTALLALGLVAGTMEDLNATFEVIELPKDLKIWLAAGGTAMWLACMTIEKLARDLFPERIHPNLLL
mmetsp:Transcript_291/g.701  ORF Transcript_291/g.701 Transcript_291/m.701 type:complete len:321 (-) Transcript_291:76-1038(-)